MLKITKNSSKYLKTTQKSQKGSNLIKTIPTHSKYLKLSKTIKNVQNRKKNI